ncbi:glycoside/pentoside/hexuronide:cation symporter, GPH family [Tessaracoccus bendigoensis DSM 12906]|uniref:Glycoside/pentoside/hexuronide:cation symporter, GPH family n=1 Tax=Tessaracoccus bendigoensis DSM 12906 TaxID=1123357 RepID=A0A1M6AGY0_9ACTN|nr:glycoside-pentoside-hexuronide (GPH):cation symporter [Tessaracoccus bendigoensis]SHI35672.1 glycoside/pentoside/hexuronide:cation symporter, GPH family [Tessaracoccus bendigoensis DSM 12906]
MSEASGAKVHANSSETKYLRWYNKIGYGAGDVGGNVVYAFIAFFVMIYLTDTMGMNPGIIGTLIMLARIFDGTSDIFFGSLIDKTNTKMGKARPWMFWAYFGCAAMIVAIFAIPPSLGDFAKYAWFFITYVLLNAVFFTANNIAFSTLTALITKNAQERVQMGSIRFIFAFGTSLLIQVSTVGLVKGFGGDAAAWRNVAILYAVIGLVVNTISVFSVRELPPEVLYDRPDEDAAEEQEAIAADKPTLLASLKLLISNKYYLMIVSVFILGQVVTAMLGMGIYFMKYILGDENYFSTFAWAINVPTILTLMATPFVVKWAKKIYWVNLNGYIIAFIGRALVIVAAFMGSIPLMLVFTAVGSIGMAPLTGTLNALIAEASENTFMTKNKRIDGMMFSATSLGVKIGGGIGVAVTGWLLAASGYVGGADVQPESAMSMLRFMYLWMPPIIIAIVVLVLSRLKVEGANDKLRTELAKS